MEQYFYRIPKIVTAVQIDFNNYRTLVQAVILCGKNKSAEDIKKYIDKNNMNLNNIFYVPSKYVLHIYITIYFT